MLELSQVHIGYKELLFKIEELSLKTGQLVSVIGKNGTGKTTFLNTILGLNKPLHGILKVDGKNIQELNRNEKVKIFSHVSSKLEGIDYLTVYDLIAMGRAPYTNMLNQLRDIDRSIVENIIDKLNLSHLKGSSTAQISDGERQIAMIGKALAQETRIIILDEPTAFLDYTNRRKALKLLSDIARENDKLILVTTHNLDLSIEFSNLILAVSPDEKRIKIYPPKTSKELLIDEVFGE
ncbi:MAG: ABC transporter ATP-binding protein [Brumimicrobium sp.]